MREHPERRIPWTPCAAAFLSALLAIMAGCAKAHSQPAAEAAAAAPSGVPEAVSYAPLPGAHDIHTISPLPGAQWTLPNGDLANTRYSTLDQLNTSNVGKLKVISTTAIGNTHGFEGAPLVVGSTMYVVTPFPNNLIAIDLTSPSAPLEWVYKPYPDPRSIGIACCDVVNRGASYADGLVVYNLLDDETVAVNAATGQQVWRTRVANIHTGETLTMAPLIVKDKVIVGSSGAELGVRGSITALDLHTGKIVWHAYNTGPDKDVLIGKDFKPYYAKDRGKNLGETTWPPGQWKRGGATVWGWISYDPELNLIYYGTSNPGVWNPDVRPGANKWSSSIIARDPDTGQVRWAYQISPHDAWDYDEIMENILVDMPWDGKMRKLLIHPGRTGFVFVLDRETGELLSAKKFEPTNWAKGFDLKTGKPIENPDKRTHMGIVVNDICPSSTGGKEVIPSAFSPVTGLLYIPAHNTCMSYEGIQANYIEGTPYLGASVKMYPGPGGYQGELVAWDPIHGRKVWSIKDKLFPLYSGVLATAGNLVFYGTMTGWLRAVDARTGKVLWQYKTGSGIIGDPITFLGPDKKQYIAIYSGIGGWMGATDFPDVSADDPYAALGVVGAMAKIKKYVSPGDAVYVFGL